MKTRLADKKRLISTLLLGAGVILTMLFGLRTCRILRQLGPPGPPPTEDVERIRGWMTVPHIARMYHIPGDYLFEQLNIPADSNNRRKSLDELNGIYAPDTPEQLTEQMKVIIQTYQIEHTLPRPPTPPEP
jgi:hypothetical protein